MCISILFDRVERKKSQLVIGLVMLETEVESRFSVYGPLLFDLTVLSRWYHSWHYPVTLKGIFPYRHLQSLVLDFKVLKRLMEVFLILLLLQLDS